MSTLRLGTRGSALALWQARTVAALLEARGHQIEITIISTSGDEGSRAAQASMPAKRMFVKEIEDALLAGDIDLAVHSAKDMSAVLPDGLGIAAALPREDPRDALVLPPGGIVGSFDAVLARLDEMPVIGTSSVRRSAQAGTFIPGASFAPIRGNVDTRLRKLDEGQYSALILAAAGMRRLGFEGRISAAIPVERCVPAPGQGIVAVQTREDDAATRGVVEGINDLEAATSLTAERTVVRALGGGCQLPLGAIALHQDGYIQMHAVVSSPDGLRVVRRTARGGVADPGRIGAMLADELAHGGAMEILDDVRRVTL